MSIPESVASLFVSADELKELDFVSPADASSFGLMNSSVYRKKLIRICNEAGLSKQHLTVIVALFTLVKNRDRVLTALDDIQNAEWKPEIVSFIQEYIVQYTYQETDNTFSAVHIPSCMPTMAFQTFCHLRQPKNVDEVLSNLWAAQLKLPDSLLKKQQAWEHEFWTNTVKKSKGEKFEGGFNKDYWTTKSLDEYPIVNQSGFEVTVRNESDFLKAIRSYQI